MNIIAGNETTPIVISQNKETINIEHKSTQINVNSDSAIASVAQAIMALKQSVANIDTNGAKESTLLQGIAELKEAFANIDLSSLETTLVSGLNEVKDAVNNIDFTDLETAIGEVKDAVANIDFSALAQEATLTQGIQAVKDAIAAIPATDLTPVAKESTLTSAKEEIIEAVNSAQVEIDTSNLASKNLEDFFGVVADDSEEIITDEEVTQELEDIFNTIFN